MNWSTVFVPFRSKKYRVKVFIQDDERFKFEFNLDSEKIQPIHDLVNNVVLSSSSKEVKDVVINGKEVMRNYEFIDLDKEKIIFEANEVLEKLLVKSNFKERIEKGEFS